MGGIKVGTAGWTDQTHVVFDNCSADDAHRNGETVQALRSA